MNKSKEKKILFIVYLRALAILLVVFSHLFGSFWYFHKSIIKELKLKLLTSDLTSVLDPLISNNVNLSLVGVAIFFLISGFIIPYSIRKKSIKQFILIRFFRIMPTYIIALCLILVLLQINQYLFQTNFEIGLFRFIANLALTQEFLSQPLYDNAYWVLLMIIKFYFLASIIQFFKSWSNFKFLLFIVLLLFFVAYTASYFLDNFKNTIYYVPLSTLIYNAYLIYFFFGISFFNLFTKKWVFIKFCLACLIFYSLFYLCHLLGIFYNSGMQIVLGWYIGFFVFAFFYLIQARLKYSRFISFLADISYPWYLTHRVSGYLMLYYLSSIGFGQYLSISLVFTISIIVAYVIHKTVEVPTYVYGKKVARRFIKPQ